jgi:ribose/xylose/arabinose/galactoside ABC-type transport system permease subunit
MSMMGTSIGRRMTFLDALIKYRTVVILLLIIAAFTILRSVFILPANLLNMLKRMSFVAITAFGMTFVITLGGLDLSVGGTAAIVGVGFALMMGAGIPAIPALLLCLCIAVALGALNGASP